MTSIDFPNTRVSRQICPSIRNNLIHSNSSFDHQLDHSPMTMTTTMETVVLVPAILVTTLQEDHLGTVVTLISVVRITTTDHFTRGTMTMVCLVMMTRGCMIWQHLVTGTMSMSRAWSSILLLLLFNLNHLHFIHLLPCCFTSST